MRTTQTTHVPIRDAAERYNVSDETIRRWYHRGIIKGHRVGPRLIRVDLASFPVTEGPAADV